VIPTVQAVSERVKAVLNTTPYRFQNTGIRFIEKSDGNALLADDMGLGKTLQTIGYLALHPEVRPALIVCPATIKYGWEREFWRHAQLGSEVAEGRQPKALDGDLFICNYDILHNWQDYFIQRGIVQVVFDECQRIKELEANRSMAARNVAKAAGRVLGLSGTPIRNRPIEFFNILNLIAPHDFVSLHEYRFAYCAPRRERRGQWNYNGASYLDELNARIQPYMLRRMKTEVLTELPKKNRTPIPIRINLKEYNEARDNFIKWLIANKGAGAARRAIGAERLVRLGELKRLAAKGKLATVKQWTREFLEDNPDKKLVLFAVHRKVSDELYETFQGTAVRIVGGMSAKAKQAAVDQFQEDPSTRLCVGNIVAMSEGVTLTAAHTVGMVELSGVPSEHEQAEDRVLRIGQTSTHMNAYYFIAMGTVEEDILTGMETKSNIIGQVVDGLNPEADGERMATFVINRLLLKHGALEAQSMR
jgi:SWI/SNF-related matrix-associated actin-dependent regulator of chromatin subfamily A-like protein 1